MDNSLFIYLEQLQLMAFFAAYPLVYLMVTYLGEALQKKGVIKINLVWLLPLAYALVGILYLGFQLKNLYPDYSFEHIKSLTENPYLKIWGLLSMLFLLPPLRKKPLLSLLHSFVFFFFLVRDLLLHFFQSADRSIVKNDMSIYTSSILINLASVVFVTLIYLLFSFLKRKRN